MVDDSDWGESAEMPEDWPDKPLHEYSRAEQRRCFGPVLLSWVTRGRMPASAERLPERGS